jgi:2-isopropylmalate synthase
MTREACLDAAVSAVTLARTFTDDVEFSAEDATRSDRDFLCRVIEAVIAAGCTTVNLPDTVGYSTPDETREFFTEIIARVPNSHRAVFSAHCHNDLGLAVANSLAAFQGGVRQVECAINGIGERAGNASLEEIVMALRVRQDRLPYDTAIRSEGLFSASQLLSQITSEPVQSNKAIVGRNAFAHEAGIHQDGVLKDVKTYEIMRPEDVGQSVASRLVLGRHSGRHAVQCRCEALGFVLSAAEIDQVYHAVISLGEHRKAIADGDLRRIVDRVRTPGSAAAPQSAAPMEAVGYGHGV